MTEPTNETPPAEPDVDETGSEDLSGVEPVDYPEADVQDDDDEPAEEPDDDEAGDDANS